MSVQTAKKDSMTTINSTTISKMPRVRGVAQNKLYWLKVWAGIVPIKKMSFAAQRNLARYVWRLDA